jgi:hypothetical protein
MGNEITKFKDKIAGKFCFAMADEDKVIILTGRNDERQSLDMALYPYMTEAGWRIEAARITGGTKLIIRLRCHKK